MQKKSESLQYKNSILQDFIQTIINDNENQDSKSFFTELDKFFTKNHQNIFEKNTVRIMWNIKSVIRGVSNSNTDIQYSKALYNFIKKHDLAKKTLREIIPFLPETYEYDNKLLDLQIKLSNDNLICTYKKNTFDAKSKLSELTADITQKYNTELDITDIVQDDHQLKSELSEKEKVIELLTRHISQIEKAQQNVANECNNVQDESDIKLLVGALNTNAERLKKIQKNLAFIQQIPTESPTQDYEDIEKLKSELMFDEEKIFYQTYQQNILNKLKADTLTKYSFVDSNYKNQDVQFICQALRSKLEQFEQFNKCEDLQTFEIITKNINEYTQTSHKMLSNLNSEANKLAKKYNNYLIVLSILSLGLVALIRLCYVALDQNRSFFYKNTFADEISTLTKKLEF